MKNTLDGFIGYFMGASKGAQLLTVSDASCHALAFRKFFKAYIRERNNRYALEDGMNIDRKEEEKILDFFQNLEAIFLSANPSIALSNVKIIDKEKFEVLKEITNIQTHNFEENYRETLQEIEVYKCKVDKLMWEMEPR